VTNDLISQAAIDIIVSSEVTSRAVYERKYRRPEWPGGKSGVTIGIGYDVGYCDHRPQLWDDWRGLIPDRMIVTLEPCIGVTGARARALLSSVSGVDVPWEAAMQVFLQGDVPRWCAVVAAKLPNFAELSPDCKGVLVSLAYNRGASFDHQPTLDDPNDRYREMRVIRRFMEERKFDRIPEQIRKMKRLWVGKGLDGLLERREAEAALFERGVAQPVAPTKPTLPPASKPASVQRRRSGGSRC
jgi:hypothetical protein